MLVKLILGLATLLFNPKKERTFVSYLVFAAWLLGLFLLGVSIPHAQEIIIQSEHGEGREWKAAALASAIELIPALIALIAFHTIGLSSKRKFWLLVGSSPFVLLTGHIQLSYYSGIKSVPILPVELAVILPYGAVLCALAVAFLLPLLAHVKVDDTQNKIDEALQLANQEYSVTIEKLNTDLANTLTQLDTVQRQLQAPDLERLALVAELEDVKAELVKASQERARVSQELETVKATVTSRPTVDREKVRAEILKPYKDGKVNQGETLDKVMKLLG